MEFIEPKLSTTKTSVCYAIVFDSGYFYVGATTNFEKRIKQHKSLIKNCPADYLINIMHEPKKCKFVKLIACDDTDKIFKFERDFILVNSGNVKMINGAYGTEKLGLFADKINEAFKSLNNNTII